MSMIAQASETIFSPQVLLWLFATAVATFLLIGAAGRRRARLTESLRAYVKQQQGETDSSASMDPPDAALTADARAKADVAKSSGTLP